MHGGLPFPPQLSVAVARIAHYDSKVGLIGGIRWLPGYLHRHSQFLCHCTEPSGLRKYDILPSSIAGRCQCQWRCLLPIWVGPTGALVGITCNPGINGFFIFMWRTTVYGYSSPGKEWHRALYTNRAYLLLTPLLVAQFKMYRWRLHCILL